MQQQLELIASIPVANRLGEGIIWDEQSSSVWWTDIHGQQLYRLSWPDLQWQSWRVPERISCLALLDESDPFASRYPLLVTFASGFALFNPETAAVHWLAKPDQLALQRGNRFNDGRVDPCGRFWAGTMVEQRQHAGQAGKLFRLDPQGCQVQRQALQIPNSLCWSKDGCWAYHADSPTSEIWRYPFYKITGNFGPGQLFCRTPEGVEPDGAIVDSTDHLLCALWGGSAVARYSPQGQLVELFSLPVSQPTCVALGGAAQQILFVTTAREGLTAQQLALQPEAGNLLIYRFPVAGIPSRRVAALPWETFKNAS